MQQQLKLKSLLPSSALRSNSYPRLMLVKTPPDGGVFLCVCKSETATQMSGRFGMNYSLSLSSQSPLSMRVNPSTERWYTYIHALP